MVNLEEEYCIDKVSIVNRADCCGKYAGVTPQVAREVNKNNLLCGQFSIFLPKNPGK